MNGTGSSLATRFRWPATWRAFAAFVRRPALPDSVTGINRKSLGAVASLFALDLVASALLLSLFALLELTGVELPTNVLEEETLTFGLILLIAVVAPPIEELIFRSWLTGRPVAATVLKYGIGGAVLGGAATGFGGPLAGAAVGLIALVLLVREYRQRRNRPTAQWYGRWFPYFYFGSAILFASVHLLNYGEDAGGILTLLVVPQFLAGLVLGYARVTFGLWASIAIHVSFNSLLVGLMLFAERFA